MQKKDSLSKREIKAQRKVAKNDRKKQLAEQYEAISGDKSGALSADKQLEYLRKLSESSRQPMKRLVRAVQCGTGLLCLALAMLIVSLSIDAALKILLVFMYLPCFYLVSNMVGWVMQRPRRTQDGRHVWVTPNLISRVPSRAFVTMFVMHATMFLIDIFNQNLWVEDAPFLEDALRCFIPGFFGIVILFILLVGFPFKALSEFAVFSGYSVLSVVMVGAHIYFRRAVFA